MINIYVINLKESVDRWKQVQSVYKKYENINLIRVDAIRHDVPWIGCLESHKKCVEIAKASNMKNIIVIEDDCLPLNNFDDFFGIKKDYLDIYDDWDIFLGGSIKTSTLRMTKIDCQNHNLYKICMAHSTFMICYNSTSYDKVLGCGQEYPIDVFWHKKLNCIIPVPFLCTTQDSFSTISNKYISFKTLFKNNQQKILDHINKN